ncbi:FAD-dependent oxidoreductase [Paracoccus alkanivorans]|nr:FAD-dependent oxidoreductase [Paracoccus alkanivorans]
MSNTFDSSDQPIAIIGAGVVGTMTARSLMKRGRRVVLIDAHDGPAALCSRANAGIMAVGHADAWASPGAVGSVLRALVGREPALKVTRLADPALWSWGTAFLRNCTGKAHHRNSDRLQRLSRYSRNLLSAAEADLGLPQDTRHDGGLYLFQNQAQFDTRTASLTGDGLEVMSRERLLEIEPALRKMGDRLKGGIFSQEDSVGDCRLFTQRTVETLRGSNRLQVCFNRRVTGLHRNGNRITAVETDQGPVECGAVVLATGVETPQLTRPLGFVPQIYPVKGYSGTWQVRDPDGVPRLPFVDETELLAVATYGGKLRVTAIAEFAGMDRSLPENRKRLLDTYVRRTFGDAVYHNNATYWSGLRPTTPGGPPFLGRVRRYDNLWVNAGHGQLGWTMSLGCGELIAQAMGGEPGALRDVSEPARWLVPI